MASNHNISDSMYFGGDMLDDSHGDVEGWIHLDGSSDNDIIYEIESDDDLSSSGSSSPRSPSSDGRRSPDNSRALVRTGPTQISLPHRPRQHTQSQNTVPRPRTVDPRVRCSRGAPQPQYYQPRPEPRYYVPPTVQPRQGHNYGPIFAAGNAKVLLGNVGSASGRCHNYGPVFTAGDAKVYAGDVSIEQIQNFFNRNR